jgi:PAS domain S-box-containing protein
MTTEADTKRPIPSLSGPALPFWRRIRWNLIFYFVVLAVVPVTVIVSLVVTELRNQAQRQVTDQLNSVVTLKTQLIDQWLSDSQSILVALVASDAEDQRFWALATTQGTDFERNQTIVDGILQESIKTTNLFDEIFFYDLNGKIQASSDSTTIGHVVTRQPYYMPSLTDPYIQPPYYETSDAQLTTLVTYRVRSISGQIVGVLAGRLNLDVLGQIMLQRTGLPGSGETYLVSEQSNYLLTPSRFAGYEQTRAYHSTGIDRALTGQDGSGTYLDYRDPPVRVIGVYRWVPQLQAALMAEVGESQALSAFNDAQLNSLLLTIAGALIAVLIGLYTATRFSRPILGLTEAASRIAAGDLSERAAVRQSNELGVLGAAFNDMADQLQQLIGSLEERVSARTRDLFLTLEVGQMATRVYQQADLLPRVADFIRERFDLYYTQIYLLDDLRRYAVLVAGTGEVGEQLLDRKHRLDLSQTSIVARAAQMQRPVLVADTETSPIHRPNPLLPETRSEVAIPLIVGGEVIGVLDMQSRAAETFREDNLPVFEAMANQLASAVRSAQSYAETQAAIDRADTINRRLTGEAWTRYLGRLGEGEAVGYEYDLQRVTPLETAARVEPPPGNGHDRDLALPVALRGQPIGTIRVEEEDRVREWTSEDVELVKDVAERVALALEQFRALDETQVALSETEEQAQRLTDLNEMAAQLSAASSLNDVYRIVATWTNRVLRGDRASLALLTPARDGFEFFGLDGAQGAIPLGAVLPRQGTWVGEVVDGQRVRRLDDLRDEPYPEARQLADQGLRSSLNVPLVVANEIVGTLNVASQQPHAFGAGDEGLIRQIASLLTSHLQTQQLFAQTRKRASEMEAVAVVGAEASATLDPDALLWNVANLVKERFNLYHAHIYLLDEAAGVLVLAAGAGEVGRLMVSHGHRITLAHQNSLVTRAARNRAGVIVNDITQTADFLPNPMLPNTRSEMAVPMIVGDRVIGVLDTQSDRAGYFTVDDQQVFSTLAAQIAVAVQNARSFAESQQRLAIIETANSAIILATLDGEFLYLNPFGSRLLGYEADEIPSLTIAATQPPDTMARVENEILPTVFKQGLWHGESVVLTKDGRQIPVDQTAFLIRDDEGQPLFLAAIMSDITERLRAEQALRASEERLRTLFENMPVMLDAVDENLNIIVWNRECERVTGYSAEEIINHPNVSELLYPDPDYRARMQTELATGQGYRDWEWDTTCKDGTVKTIAWFNISDKYPIPGWTQWGIGVDITERKRAEETVRRRASEMEAVAQVGAEAAATLDVQDMLWNVSNLTKERFDLYHAHIYLADASGSMLVLAAGAGPVGQVMVQSSHRIPLNQERGLVARAARTRRGVIENDVTKASGFLPNPMLPNTRAEMAVPMVVGEHLIGVLDVQSDQVERFTEEDQNVFSTLAAQVAVSVQNARQFEQTQLRVRDLQVINQVAEYLRGGEDLESTLERVIDTVLEALGGDNAVISVLDFETQVWQGMVGAGEGMTTGRARTFSAPVDEYPHGLEVVQTGRAVAVTDARTYPGFPVQFIEELGVKSALALPVLGDDTSAGVLFVNFNRHQRTFTPEELALAHGVADQIAVGYAAKQAEANLAEREQLMRTIIDTSPDWIFAKDTDYRYLLVNRAFAEYYGGRTPEEMIGKDDYDLGTPAELIEGNPERGIVGFRTDDRTVIEGGESILNPYDVVNFADGTEHILDTSKLPLRDVEGRIVGVLGFSHDITERLRAQEERERLVEDLQRVSERLQERLKEISALQEIGAYSDENLEIDAYLDRVVRRIPTSMQYPNVCAAAIEFEGRLFGDKRAMETPWKLAIPLRISRQRVGTLSVGYLEEREFAPEESPHITAVAERVVTYIQGRRLFEQVQRRAAEMQAVSEVGAEASATFDPDEMLQSVVTLAKERFGLYHAHIYLMDDTGENLVLVAGSGSIGQMMVKAGHRIRTAHERSLVARAARRRQGVVVNDVASALDFLPNPMLPATRSELAVAMIVGDQVIGVLDVQSDEIDHFTDEDLVIQSTLASQVAVAVNNARLFEQTQQRAAEMQAVAEVGAQASATLDQASLLWNVVNLVRDRFNLYHAHIYLLDDRQQNLILTAGAGEAGKLMVTGGHRIPLRHEQSLVVRAVRTRQSVIVNDVTRAPDFLPNPMLPRTRSELATPLVVGGRVIGALDVQSERVDRFSAEDVQVQSTLASQIAVAVNNAQLFAEQLDVADRLREVDRLKSEFLASMSHELRTPLNSIIGYAEVMLDGIDGDLTDDMTEDVGAIHGSGKHLLNLINDILDLAKIEAGQMDLVVEDFELGPLVEDTTNIQRVLLKDKPVDLVLDIPADLPYIHADSLRVRQVIGNLVTNAIKFTEQGSITVRAREDEQDPDLIQISVIDTGMGMRPDQLKVIFDRFRQVDQSHTRRAGGTGLGLSITRQLVQMHGGDIWVESEAGVGSAFHFTLPRATETVQE